MGENNPKAFLQYTPQIPTRLDHVMFEAVVNQLLCYWLIIWLIQKTDAQNMNLTDGEDVLPNIVLLDLL